METQSETDICNPLSNAVIKLAEKNFLKMMSKVHSLNLGSLRIFSTFWRKSKKTVNF